MTAKSVLMRPQGLRSEVRVPASPCYATALVVCSQSYLLRTS